MEVVFLGTGTGRPCAHRASPGLAVLHNGFTVLVDSGPGTLRQLARADISHNDLDAVFYTHFHPDHTSELVPYLFAAQYWPGVYRKKPAEVYGPEGFLDFYESLKLAYGKWIVPPRERVVLCELPLTPFEFECGPMTVESGPIPHTPHSIGYRFTSSSGGVLVVTGDTEYGPELVELARGADLLVTECSFPEGHPVGGHLCPSLAGRAAREAEVGALALTHFYPETEGYDLLGPAREEYSGPIILARDLDRRWV